MIYADVRDVEDAVHLVKQVLNNDRNNVNALHLLALLLSSQQRYEDASVVIDSALLLPVQSATTGTTLYSRLQLMLTKNKLLLRQRNYESAIRILEEAGKLLFNQTQIVVHHTSASTGETITRLTFNITAADKQQFHRHYTSEYIAPSPTLSKELPIHKSNALVEVLLAVAETYIAYAQKHADEKLQQLAISAVQRANVLVNDDIDLSSVYTTMAHIASYDKQWQQAADLYKQAIHYHPINVTALISLADLHSQGHTIINDAAATAYLTTALQVDATQHRAWYLYANLLKQNNDNNNDHEAQQYLSTASQLQSSTPIRSYSNVTRSIE